MFLSFSLVLSFDWNTLHQSSLFIYIPAISCNADQLEGLDEEKCLMYLQLMCGGTSPVPTPGQATVSSSHPCSNHPSHCWKVLLTPCFSSGKSTSHSNSKAQVNFIASLKSSDLTHNIIQSVSSAPSDVQQKLYWWSRLWIAFPMFILQLCLTFLKSYLALVCPTLQRHIFSLNLLKFLLPLLDSCYLYCRRLHIPENSSKRPCSSVLCKWLKLEMHLIMDSMLYSFTSTHLLYQLRCPSGLATSVPTTSQSSIALTSRWICYRLPLVPLSPTSVLVRSIKPLFYAVHCAVWKTQELHTWF